MPGTNGRAILVLGCAPTSEHGHDQMVRLASQARRRGLQITGMDIPGNLPALDHALVDQVIPADVHDYAAMSNFAREAPAVDAVVTFAELCVESAAAIAAVWGLSGISVEVAHTIRNKDLCRERLRQAGFPQPETLVTSDYSAAVAFMGHTAPGPWIVKPRAGLGSLNVDLVADPASLDSALRHRPSDSEFLIETFVSGTEFSVEGIIVRGDPIILGVTQKLTGSRFVERGHRIPAVVSMPAEVKIRSELLAAMRALDMTHGLFHVEFWIVGSEIVLGEFHARPGGGYIPAMLEYVHPGLELYGALLDDLLGCQASMPPIPNPRRAAGVDFIDFPPGRILSITGWDKVMSDPAVIAGYLATAVGDTVAEVRWSADRPAAVVVGAESGEAVELKLKTIRQRLHVMSTGGEW